MLDRVKDFFGIEGVRLALEVAEGQRLSTGMLRGQLLFESLRDQVVTGIELTLAERYTRGRGDERETTVYQLGELTDTTQLSIGAGEQVLLPFAMSFTARLTPVEQWSRSTFLGGPMSKLAKFTVGANSIYTLNATATVRGVTLQPTVTETVLLT